MKNYAMKQSPRYGLKNHTGINYFVIVEFELMFLLYPLKHIMEGLL